MSREERGKAVLCAGASPGMECLQHQKHRTAKNTECSSLLLGLVSSRCCADLRCAAAPAPAGTAAPAPLRSRTLKDESVTLPEA